MSSLYDRAGSDSEGEVEFDLPDSEIDVGGWNDVSDFERFTKGKNLSSKLIIQANRLVTLEQTLSKFRIDWQIQSSHTGWTHKSKCPFPDHKDDTPSFGFNTKDQRFYCFGCRKSGNTVQFLSYMSGRDPVEIAKEILLNEHNSDELILMVEDQSPQIEEKLFSFSKLIREFLKNNNSIKALKFVEALTWNLDVYLEKNALNGTIKLESLTARLEKLKEFLESYGK